MAPASIRGRPPVVPHSLEQPLNIDVVWIKVCKIFSMHVNVFLDLLSIVSKLILLLLGEILVVANRDLVNLFLRDHSHVDEALLVLEELISDFVVAFVERGHESGEDIEFT